MALLIGRQQGRDLRQHTMELSHARFSVERRPLCLPWSLAMPGYVYQSSLVAFISYATWRHGGRVSSKPDRLVSGTDLEGFER